MIIIFGLLHVNIFSWSFSALEQGPHPPQPEGHKDLPLIKRTEKLLNSQDNNHNLFMRHQMFEIS